jgi:hypothetical protein
LTKRDGQNLPLPGLEIHSKEPSMAREVDKDDAGKIKNMASTVSEPSHEEVVEVLLRMLVVSGGCCWFCFAS